MLRIRNGASPFSVTSILLVLILLVIWVKILQVFSPTWFHSYSKWLLVSQDHINVFGTDYDTPDGTCIRDYIHVMDIAEGHVKALEFMQRNNYQGYDVFNLGTGKGSSVLEVIRSMEKACGFELKKVMCSRRAGDRPDAYAVTDKAEKMLNWKAKYSVDDACRDAWNWQHKHPNGYAEFEYRVCQKTIKTLSLVTSG